MNNQNQFNQLRNKLGQTAYPTSEGLETVHMENDRMTSIAKRLQSLDDTFEGRMYETVGRYRKEILRKKAIGAIPKEQPVEIHSFNRYGVQEKEII